MQKKEVGKEWNRKLESIVNKRKYEENRKTRENLLEVKKFLVKERKVKIESSI